MLYRSLLRRLLFRLPPETAHELALKFLANAPGLAGLVLGKSHSQKPFGDLERFGLKFSNPVGLAAGFDKDGIALDGLAALGFAFIEAGTVTFYPQPGNDRPRLFRLPQDKALINRAGFNNQGATAFANRVTPASKRNRSYVLGVSIGKSKTVPPEKAVEDYLNTLEIIHPVADYVAVNVSSPNTPGLRDLQEAKQLETLLAALQRRNRDLKQNRLPILVKISPDVTPAELEDIAAVSLSSAIDGIIATNTTIGREGLTSSPQKIQACGDGGLSGLPMRKQSNTIIARLYRLTAGAIPLIGVGGIFTAEDAWEKVSAGASLIQLYTGFIYQGPGIVGAINDGLKEILERRGIRSLDEAVGCQASEMAMID